MAHIIPYPLASNQGGAHPGGSPKFFIRARQSMAPRVRHLHDMRPTSTPSARCRRLARAGWRHRRSARHEGIQDARRAHTRIFTWRKVKIANSAFVFRGVTLFVPEKKWGTSNDVATNYSSGAGHQFGSRLRSGNGRCNSPYVLMASSNRWE